MPCNGSTLAFLSGSSLVVPFLPISPPISRCHGPGSIHLLTGALRDARLATFSATRLPSLIRHSAETGPVPLGDLPAAHKRLDLNLASDMSEKTVPLSPRPTGRSTTSSTSSNRSRNYTLQVPSDFALSRYTYPIHPGRTSMVPMPLLDLDSVFLLGFHSSFRSLS